MKLRQISLVIAWLWSGLVIAQHCDNETWNWWEDNESFWVAKTNNQQGAPLVDLKKPFHDNTVPGKLVRIQFEQDYLPSKGWELMYRDFGCGSANEMPYFILYNKFTGILRVFVYVHGDDFNDANGYAMRLKYIESGDVPAFIGGVFPELTPDRHLDGAANADDYEVVYVGGKDDAFRHNWMVGDFHPNFDPHMSEYQDPTAIINIFRITKWDLEATYGDETTTEITDDITFVGPQVSRSGGGGAGAPPLNMIAGGAVAVAALFTSDEEINKLIKDRFQQVEDYLGTAGLEEYKPVANKFKEYNNFREQGKNAILEFTKNPSVGGAVVGLIGIAGALYGHLSGDDEATAPSYSLTSTTTNQVIKGTIEGTSGLVPISFKIPGSTFTSVSGNRLPYYDCSYGIATLAETPRVDTVSFNWKQSGNHPTEAFKAYTLSEDMHFMVNDRSGYDEVEIKVGLGAEVPIQWVKEKYGLDVQIKQGRLNVVNAREVQTSDDVEIPDGKVMLLSQIVDFKTQAKGMTIYLPDEAGAKLFVRIYAVLKSSSNPDRKFIYARDFDLKIGGGDSHTGTIGPGVLPPHANYSNAYYATGGSYPYPFDKDDITTSGDIPLRVAAYPVVAYYHSLVANQNINYSGTIENRRIGDPRGPTGEPAFLQAAVVTLEDGFRTVVNDDPISFITIKSTDVQYPSGGNGQHTVFSPVICTYNENSTSASRITESAEEADLEEQDPGKLEELSKHVEIWPVPAADQLNLYLPDGGHIHVLDMRGTEVLESSTFEAGNSVLNVSRLGKGIYLLRYETAHGVVTKKFIKE